jgi:hypothetical protein
MLSLKIAPPLLNRGRWADDVLRTDGLMQIAGGQCWICHQRIGTMRSGSGCESCQIVVHQACAPDGGCPKCGQPFLPVEEVHARPSASLQAQRDRPKTVTFLGRLALVGAFLAMLRALVGVGILASDGPDGAWRIIEGATMAALSAVLGLGLLAGHGWARRFYLWGTPFLLIVNLALSDPNSMSGLQTWVFVAEVGLYAMWAFFLTRPRATQFFRERELVRVSSA